MGNMMYTVVAGERKYFILFLLYRVITLYVFMTLVTIFSAVRFSSSTVPDYADRNNDTFQRDFGLLCYIWAWAAGIASQCMAVFFLLTDELRGSKSGTSRDILGYLSQRNFAEAEQLIEFGVKLDSHSVNNDRNVE